MNYDWYSEMFFEPFRKHLDEYSDCYCIGYRVLDLSAFKWMCIIKWLIIEYLLGNFRMNVYCGVIGSAFVPISAVGSTVTTWLWILWKISIVEGFRFWLRPGPTSLRLRPFRTNWKLRYLFWCKFGQGELRMLMIYTSFNIVAICSCDRHMQSF